MEGSAVHLDVESGEWDKMMILGRDVLIEVLGGRSDER